jgi:hypothetical protein
MPFKPPPTKAEIRAQLNAEINQYLQKGGRVEKVARGVSGRMDNLPMRKIIFDTPRESRTYVTDLVAGIDARRKPGASKKPAKAPRKPTFKTLYDDFGEPLRKILVEE